MTRLTFCALIACLPLLPGCEFVSDVIAARNPAPGAALTDVDDITSAFDAPGINTGAVRVRIVNEAAIAADVRTTLRTAGIVVHRSSRRVAASSNSVVVGPDQADSILVEITQLKLEPRTLPSRAFFLGLDFSPGQTVIVRIEGDPPVVTPPVEPPPIDPPPVEPPPVLPPVVVVIDLGAGVDIIRIDPIQFLDIDPHTGGELPLPPELPPPGGVSGPTGAIPPGGFGGDFPGGLTPPPPGGVTTIPGWPGGGAGQPPGNGSGDPDEPDAGDTPGAPVDPNDIAVVVDVDLDPTNGNESIYPLQTDGREDPVRWDPTTAEPGVYWFYVDRVVDGQLQRVGPQPTAVRINAQPDLIFDSPTPGAVLVQGDPLHVGWAGRDDDDDARVSIWLDPDESVSGDEIILAVDVAEDDVAQRTLTFDTAAVKPGFYSVNGLIQDPLVWSRATAGVIEILPRSK